MSVFLPIEAEISYPICILRESRGVYDIIGRMRDLFERQKTVQGRPVSSPVRGGDVGADRKDEYRRIEIGILRAPNI